MTKSFNDFLSRAGTPRHVEEHDLAEAHIGAEKQLIAEKQRLVSHLRAEKVDGKIIATFDASVEEVLPELDAAEAKAAECKQAVDEYLRLLGNYDSVTSMTEQLAHLKIRLRNADGEAKAVLERAIRTGKSASDAAMMPEVMDAAIKAERLREDLQPQITDLLVRVKVARKLLMATDIKGD